MNMSRRQVLAGVSAMGAPGLLWAQSTYPSKPIEIVVPATPGGGADIGARKAGELLFEALGQPVIVKNVAGAGGAIAASYVARAEKTGYVIGMASDSTVVINPLVVPEITYKLEDFQLLTTLYTGGFALAVGKDFPANTVKEFVDEVRRRGDLSCAMFGVVSSPRLITEMFMADTGINLVPVPYKGENEAVRDVIAGIVPAFFGTTANLLAQHKAGALKILGISTLERVKTALPDVPTFKELGLNNTVYRWFHGLMVPAGTPKDVVEKLSSTLAKIVMSDRFRAGIAMDLTPTVMTPVAFTDMAVATRERVQGIIKSRNLKV